jgi:hypothetical protein
VFWEQAMKKERIDIEFLMLENWRNLYGYRLLTTGDFLLGSGGRRWELNVEGE